MQIVIDISEERYKAICEKYDTFPADMKEWGLAAIKNGTPLPKGHGRIVDISHLEHFYCEEIEDLEEHPDYNDVKGFMQKALDNLRDVSTIIEADNT